MAAKRKSVLIVDDEVLFLRTVADGFQSHAEEIELLTARHGREALFILGGRPVDMVITDLHMPEMDGFELLAAMSRSYPNLPVLVMTAFGTADISARLKGLGVDRYLEKPMEFDTLAEKVLQTLSMGATGNVSGITLSSFLQIIALDRKTCQLRVWSAGQVGHLSFEEGVLIDARTGTMVGDSAGLAIVCWEAANIEILPARSPVFRTVQMSLTTMLIEGMRQEDEKKRDESQVRPAKKAMVPTPPVPPPPPPSSPPSLPSPRPSATKAKKGTTTALSPLTPLSPMPPAAATDSPPPGATPPDSGISKENVMSAKEKLEEFAKIEGFMSAGVYSPAGEDLALLRGEIANVREIGVLANNVLMNAQKACLEMNCGRGQLVHVEGEKAHILVRCMNEGSDPLKAQPGRAHIHTVLILKPDASIGMAKLKLGQVVEKLAEDFR